MKIDTNAWALKEIMDWSTEMFIFQGWKLELVTS